MKIKESEIIALMSVERTRNKGVQLMMDAYQSRLYWHIRRLIVDHDLAQDVLQDLDSRVDLVLDGGRCPGGVPSTVVDCTSTEPRILREGALTAKQILLAWGDPEA